jgi:hypothetical protein
MDEAWWRALDQAWQSFLAGTTPVGAVVADAAGEVVAEGRGQRYEKAACGPQDSASMEEAMAATRGLLSD